MKAIVKAKEWGRSVAVVLPADEVKKAHVKPGDNLIIHFEKKQNILKQLFGVLKFKKPIEDVIKENRRELESKWDK